MDLPQLKPSSWPVAYQKLVGKMHDEKISDLGDMNYRDQDQFKNQHGEIRAASIDLSREGRIERTCAIRNISLDDLDRLHAYEKKTGSFIYASFMIKKFLKGTWEPTVLSESRMSAFEDFNNQYRPIPRQHNGMSVPPYFPYDNEFDGMEYQHSWDKNILIHVHEFDLPPLINKRTGRMVLAESE